MAFLVLAYPEIKPSDYKLIQHYRRENDGFYYNLVEPQFTILIQESIPKTSKFLICARAYFELRD
jgi:hypothetical protein